MLTRDAVARRILQLPQHQQAAAAQLALKVYGRPDGRRGAKAQAARDPRARAKYAGDPWAYFADVLGVTLSPQQQAALELIEKEPRVLLPSANNMGKTFLLGGHAVYTFDAVAAQPDEELDLPEQGARILLPGPDAATVFATVYSEMLALASRAEARGHLMPGRRSENSVLWRVRAQWEVEAFNPPPRVNQDVAHTASGRHHRNQNAYIEEGQGVGAAVWKATEGMCSSGGNKIISSFNPTEAVGPAFQRARASTYSTLHLDAFDHPNVLERRAVIPAAVDFRVIDGRVADECVERGRYPDAKPDPDYDDFLYALPPTKGMEESGSRPDGVRGHVEGEVRVYRPSPTFVAQVRGQYPRAGDTGLFDAGSLDASVARYQAEAEQYLHSTPDRVGVDSAREGGDDTCAAPAWGDTAEVLLRAYLDVDGDPEAIRKLQAHRRARVGEIRTMVPGDGPDVALQLFSIFGPVAYTMDSGSVGASPMDHLAKVLGADVVGVSFAESAPEPVRVYWEPWFDNMRASLYWRAARVLKLGLVDTPPDRLLREELLAHRLKPSSRVVEYLDPRTEKLVKKRVQSFLLCPKDEVKARIGRSPDRADAYVLALFGAPPVKGLPTFTPIALPNLSTTFRLGR